MRRSPPPVLANESLLVTVLPLTAILTDRLPAPVVGDGAAAAAHLEALTASGARHRGLFFVHGHRHRREWQLHSAALKLSAEQWLVRESDLLMVSTDITATTAEMVYLMGLYPQSTRMLIHTGVNTGYRCGLLHALSASHWIWHRHDSVVFTHPDVFLLPPAVHACMHVCMRACAPDDLLLQTQLTQQFTAVRTCIIHACMHACIRTRRLVAAPSGERGSHHSLTHSLSGLLTCAAQVYELGAYLAAHRSAHSLLATSTKMFWYRNNRPLAFLSDLFAFYPAQLPLRCKVDSCARRPSRYWQNASVECSMSLVWGRGLLKPEQALYRVQVALNASHAELLPRTIGWRRTLPSTSGVWHTHNVSQVATALQRLRGERQLNAQSAVEGA